MAGLDGVGGDPRVPAVGGRGDGAAPRRHHDEAAHGGRPWAQVRPGGADGGRRSGPAPDGDARSPPDSAGHGRAAGKVFAHSMSQTLEGADTWRIRHLVKKDT